MMPVQRIGAIVCIMCMSLPLQAENLDDEQIKNMRSISQSVLGSRLQEKRIVESEIADDLKLIRDVQESLSALEVGLQMTAPVMLTSEPESAVLVVQDHTIEFAGSDRRAAPRPAEQKFLKNQPAKSKVRGRKLPGKAFDKTISKLTQKRTRLDTVIADETPSFVERMAVRLNLKDEDTEKQKKLERKQKLSRLIADSEDELKKMKRLKNVSTEDVRRLKSRFKNKLKSVDEVRDLKPTFTTITEHYR